jgi:hypothetical protein
MKLRTLRVLVLSGLVVGLSSLLPSQTLVVRAQQQPGAPPQTATDQSVPSDLKPLLVAKQSEMRLVTLRYTADRNTLSANYLGGAGGGRGGGRGGAGAPGGATPASVANVSPSPSRVARLKRYNMSWLAALAKIDTNRLSPAARTDLVALNAMIQAHQTQLDADARALAELAPLLPFAPSIIQIVESRIRMEDIDAQKSAGLVTSLTKQIGQIRARVDAGASGAATPDALRVNRDLAARTAVTVDTLRSSLAEWFNIYNGYDPMFTWWMGLPFKQADAALQSYAGLLRDKVAGADLASNVPPPTAAALVIAPAPATRMNEVPDLQEILNLSQDEMSLVVARFRGPMGGGRGRGGATGGSGPAAQYFRDWLTALKTLNFDTLSRNAQVDYLFIKKTSEQLVARADVTLPANNPRKADDSGIPGAARGRQGLIFDLQDEMIPYTPEELMVLAEKEFAWCEEEMKKASRQMGFGDDWKKALEKVKTIYVPPGQQVSSVRGMLFEAVDYLRERDLVTVPQVAGESLRFTMLSPERQLTAPFFLGGSEILIAYPTDTMDYDTRMQAMRGNNVAFSHAVAFHEMIPGHNLVGYMNQRYAGYRANLGASSPFYSEGWPLYWETLMYDFNFHNTPEEKVGALFWRMHRSARIVFSLKFHMGQWSPAECIDFLVEKVGHERDNATAEVRRSFAGGYGPLYQAAYLLGGLQLRGLRKELVDTKILTEKQFHDEILRQGSMPISFVRLAVGRQTLARDMNVDWKFYGEIK